MNTHTDGQVIILGDQITGNLWQRSAGPRIDPPPRSGESVAVVVPVYGCASRPTVMAARAAARQGRVYVLLSTQQGWRLAPWPAIDWELAGGGLRAVSRRIPPPSRGMAAKPATYPAGPAPAKRRDCRPASVGAVERLVLSRRVHRGQPKLPRAEVERLAREWESQAGTRAEAAARRAEKGQANRAAATALAAEHGPAVAVWVTDYVAGHGGGGATWAEVGAVVGAPSFTSRERLRELLWALRAAGWVDFTPNENRSVRPGARSGDSPTCGGAPQEPTRTAVCTAQHAIDHAVNGIGHRSDTDRTRFLELSR